MGPDFLGVKSASLNLIPCVLDAVRGLEATRKLVSEHGTTSLYQGAAK